MNYSHLAGKVKTAAARAKEKISSSMGKIEFSQLLPKAKKAAFFARDSVLSLRTMKFSLDDPKLLWISGIAFVIMQATITALLWRVADPWAILSHQLSFNVDDFLVQRDNWGPEKVRLYLQHYWLDFIHPAIYAIFFRCLLTRIYASHPTQYLYHCLAFPIAAAIYDELENICQLVLMAGWTEANFIFYIGALGAYLKWLLLLAAFSAATHALLKDRWNRYLES